MVLYPFGQKITDPKEIEEIKDVTALSKII